MDSSDAVEHNQPAATLEWSNRPATPAEFIFEETPGLKVELTGPVGHPLTYFELMFTADMISAIVKRTNSFAQQSDPNWVSTTDIEIVHLLGTYIHKNNVKHIPDKLVANKKKFSKLIQKYPFRPTMSRTRFLELCANLRFGDETQIGSDAVGLLKPLLKALRQQFATIYYPTRNLSIFNQKLEFAEQPDSPDTLEAEIFQLHDANRFVYNFWMRESVDLTPNSGQTVVEKLTENLSGKGHSLYLKNEFNSVQLALSLLQQKCYLTGTYVPEESVNFPPEIFNSTSPPIQLQREGVFIEKRVGRMATISTEMANERSHARRAEKRSRLVQNYREVLTSIYLSEFLDNLPFVPKGIPYSTTIFIYLLNVCVQNAFVLYSERLDSKRRSQPKRLGYLEFKFLLAKQLRLSG